MNWTSTGPVGRPGSDSHERDEQNERTDVEVGSVAERVSLPVTRTSSGDSDRWEAVRFAAAMVIVAALIFVPLELLGGGDATPAPAPVVVSSPSTTPEDPTRAVERASRSGRDPWLWRSCRTGTPIRPCTYRTAPKTPAPVVTTEYPKPRRANANRETHTPATGAGHKGYARSLVAPGQWPCLDRLWEAESGWRTSAVGSLTTHGRAYGIPQRMSATRPPLAWLNDGQEQIRWGLGYIAGRYGSPCAAWSAFNTKGWY